MIGARSGRRLLAALAALLLALLPAGCGIGPQDRPEPVTTGAPTPTESAAARPAGPRLTVYFVRGATLAPVERPTGAASTGTALEHLAAGPTPAEADTGIRTALPPDAARVEDDPAGSSATVTLTRAFTGLSGGAQLLAVAQVVWTLTELPGITEVHFAVETGPVEVPTDAGLADRPVGRADYRSVAPARPTPTAAPTEDRSVPAGPSPR